MSAYYTREEAARVLGVTLRRVDAMRGQGKLRTIHVDGGRIVIPRQDVDKAYDAQLTGPDNLAQFEALEARMKILEEALDVTRSMVAANHARSTLPDAAVLLQREAALGMMAKASWPVHDIANMALWCRKLTDDEAECLFATYEERALLPFVELLQRMMDYVASTLTTPSGPLDHLNDHLVSALDLLRMRTYYRYRVTRVTPREISASILERLMDPSVDVDRLLLQAVLSQAA
jgi:excisionase family DNA binding protein